MKAGAVYPFVTSIKYLTICASYTPCSPLAQSTIFENKTGHNTQQSDGTNAEMTSKGGLCFVNICGNPNISCHHGPNNPRPAKPPLMGVVALYEFRSWTVLRF